MAKSLRDADDRRSGRQQKELHAHDDDNSWEHHRGVGDPNQRYSLWRLCPCDACSATGKLPVIRNHIPATSSVRCNVCRGEGRELQLLATCGSPEALGVTIVTLALEDELADCPIGVLDDMGEPGHKWLVRPWQASARNVSDAGKLLRQQRDILK